MIKALRPRIRPDSLRNQVRAGGRSLGRRVYLASVVAFVAFILVQIAGPLFYLEADGLVYRERTVLSPIYSVRVQKVHVRPGDQVRQGQPILTVQSYDALDRIAQTAEKHGSLAARDGQIQARLGLLERLLDSAYERLDRAKAAASRVQTLASKDLSPAPRQSEVARDLFDAERELAQVLSERQTLSNEMTLSARTRAEVERLLDSLTTAYNGGLILARDDGQVGPKLPPPGSVFKTGDVIYEVYKGPVHIVAFMPTSRFYGVSVGQRVVVTDGTHRHQGVIERLEPVTDALPPEFQSAFRSVERPQMVRIALGEEVVFPLLAKVKVASVVSPTNAFAVVKGMVAESLSIGSGARNMHAGRTDEPAISGSIR